MEEQLTNALLVLCIGAYAAEKMLATLKSRGVDLQDLAKKIDSLYASDDKSDEVRVNELMAKKENEQAIVNTYKEIRMVRKDFDRLLEKLNQ